MMGWITALLVSSPARKALGLLLATIIIWSAPTEVVHQLGYDDPTFWRTRRWLESERSRKTLF